MPSNKPLTSVVTWCSVVQVPQSLNGISMSLKCITPEILHRNIWHVSI